MEGNWRTERFPLGEKLLYWLLSAGGANLEKAALVKPWVFQAYVGTDSGPSGKECSPLTTPLNDG